MEGKHVLDVALVIALMVQATKLSDLVFSEKQKKAVQNKVEAWTLYLEGLNLQQYFLLILNERLARTVMSVLGLIFVFWYCYFSFIPESKLDFRNRNELFQNVGLLLFVLAFTLSLTYVAFEGYGYNAMKWLLEKKFSVFLLRFACIVCAVCIVMVFFQLAFTIANNTNGIWSWVVVIPIALLICAVLLSGAILIASILIFYGCLIIVYKVIFWFFVTTLLKLIKWLLRRIVEYNKGAVAAITLLITVALGVIDVWMKTKK